jgi:hypothetical protein
MQKWARDELLERPVLHFGIQRTVPAGERKEFKRFTSNNYSFTGSHQALEANIRQQVEKILGKDISSFTRADVSSAHSLYVGGDGKVSYSEFHFGAGESSIIRMVSLIESAPENSLVLVEEIENGLHPVAVRRMVEYLIDVAERRSIQSIFTTHSEDAITPLPSEAIWSSSDGKARQGRISIEALRALTGKIEEKVAIFVEDEFAKSWVTGIIRICIPEMSEEIGVYALSGDGRAYSVHMGHLDNPAINTVSSICLLDGDSSKNEDLSKSIIKLPGAVPESVVFDYVRNNIEQLAMKLAIAVHLPAESEAKVKQAIISVSLSNRDPHLLFNQIGQALGFISETIVTSAFVSLWVAGNLVDTQQISDFIRSVVEAA